MNETSPARPRARAVVPLILLAGVAACGRGGSAVSTDGLHGPCLASCAAGQTCTGWCGIAGCDPNTTVRTCEIRCGATAPCPLGLTCVSVANLGEVCGRPPYCTTPCPAGRACVDWCAVPGCADTPQHESCEVPCASDAGCAAGSSCVAHDTPDPYVRVGFCVP